VCRHYQFELLSESKKQDHLSFKKWDFENEKGMTFIPYEEDCNIRPAA